MLYIKEELTDKQARFLNSVGEKVIDSILLKGYELYLLKSNNEFMNRLYDGIIYNLALQKEGRDFTNPDQQFEKIPFESLPKSIIPLMMDKLKEWIGKYGNLVADSYNESKLDQYKKLFNRFKISIEEKIVKISGEEHKFLVLGK